MTPFLRAQPMPATAVRESFFPLVERLSNSAESIIVTRNGKPIVVLMGKATYERLKHAFGPLREEPTSA